jgi:hypothetical protein
MEDGKTLSKNLMYAPLVAYHKLASIGASDNNDSGNSSTSRMNHPSQYASNNPNVLKSLNESSLASILHFVSCDYHHNRATVNDAKNNGSRPLGLPDMEDRIRQRAVTLLGGGINVSIPVVKTTIRSKKRRHRSWEEVEPVLKKLSSSLEEEMTSESESGRVISFLQKLNSAWNDYAWKLLMKDKATTQKQRLSEDDLKAIEVRLGALMGSKIDNRKNSNSSAGSNSRSGSNFFQKGNVEDDSINLIGAHVQVKSSNSRTSWIGRFGVLIGETTNTYRIASYTRTRRKKSNTNSAEAASKNKEIEMLVLPKVESSLQLILPSIVGFNKDDNMLNPEEDITIESMIAVPDEAICICIADQKQML